MQVRSTAAQIENALTDKLVAECRQQHAINSVEARAFQQEIDRIDRTLANFRQSFPEDFQAVVDGRWEAQKR
ncbi:MAG: hypothetical protein AAGI24_04125 [Pseudomonadota bacterium]